MAAAGRLCHSLTADSSISISCNPKSSARSPHSYRASFLTSFPFSSTSVTKKSSQLRHSHVHLTSLPRPVYCGSLAIESIESTQHQESLFAIEYGENSVVVGDMDAVDADTKIKLECDDSGCVWVAGKNFTGLDDSKTQGNLHCGIKGCYYDSAQPVKSFKVLEGSGWRLGYETSPETEDSFCAMVGAGGWSIALTASEFNDFTNLIQVLRKGIVTMDQDGVIGREKVQMKVERGSVWMEAVFPGKRLPSLQKLWNMGERTENKAFEIRFQLAGTNNRRQAEGYWPAEAVMDMLKKVDEFSRISVGARVLTVASPAPRVEEGEREREREGVLLHMAAIA